MKTIIMIIAAAVLAMSCEDKQSVEQDWPWEDPEVEVPAPEEPEEPEKPAEDATIDKWYDVTSDYGTLPEYIKVYKAPESLVG